MELHANAALSLKGRRSLARSVVIDERTVTEAAVAAGVSVRCARKWVGRYRLQGDVGLRDRSSAPRRIPHRTSPERVAVICQLRRLRFTGPEIAETLGMALSTVSAVLKRSGMGKLGRIGLQPAVRYEHAAPGDLIHIDVKKLGRIHNGVGHRFLGKPGQRAAAGTKIDAEGHRRWQTGWEFVHIAIDDHSRLAYAEVLPDEKATTAIAFLRRATAFYGRYGITVQRLITDNGSAYRSAIHALACRQLGDPTPPHPRLPAPDQRKSRTVHPHHARRLGLRRDLRHQR